ncbi:MAG: C39 family peptidase [Lachnospiraceae bacterium]
MDGYDDYEELTPEELEQERRRKAAARRRRLEAREQRRKKRRQEAIIRCSLLLLAVILVIFIIVKIISGIVGSISDKKEKTTEEITEQITEEEVIAEIDESIIAKDLPATREDALEMIKGFADTDSEYKDIYDNAAVFSDDLLRYVAVNPEMKRFVIDYIAKISIVFEGNFTLTTPVEEVPLYLQFDEQWGYADYGESVIAIRGAGPVCLSMVYTYIKQEGSQNPIKVGDMAMNNGYLTEEGGTADVLFTDGAANLGLKSQEMAVDKDEMIDALANGKLLICAVNSGDFTKTTSYIVIKDYKSGLFLINDPMSEARSKVGWDFPRLSSQIAKMWVLEDGGDSVAPTGDGSNTDTPVEGDGGTTPSDEGDGTPAPEDGGNGE